MKTEDYADEIVELVPVAIWELLPDANEFRDGVIKQIQSALTSRTEQCAKIAEQGLGMMVN